LILGDITFISQYKDTISQSLINALLQLAQQLLS